MAGASAPLLSLPGIPVPAGATAEWVQGSGGVRLRAALFQAGRPRGTVILSAGRTEPIEKYFEVVEDVRARGYCVVAHDWRSHGLSQRLSSDPVKGHAHGWRPFVEDFACVLDAFEARAPKPWVALGHSMGGGLTALALAEGETRLSGAVLSAPMMGLSLARWRRLAARWLSFGLARVGGGEGYAEAAADPVGAAFEGNVLTHDRERWERTAALLSAYRELQLGSVTWGWLDFAFALSARLRRAPRSRFALPMTLVLAEQERLVDNQASRAFAAKVGARCVMVPGAYHELLMETDAVRTQFWREFDAVAAQVGGG